MVNMIMCEVLVILVVLYGWLGWVVCVMWVCVLVLFVIRKCYGCVFIDDGVWCSILSRFFSIVGGSVWVGL